MAPATKASCHNYFPAPNLDVSSTTAAGTCTICALKSHIEEIKEIQTALDSRGGIFKSKTAEPRTKNGWMYANHQTWTKKWREAKIKCCRFVEALEKLRDEHPDMIEDWGMDEALYLWELAADECCKVPGYKYVGDALKDDMALGETKAAESTVPTPIVISAPRDGISPEDDSGWDTVTRIWKKRSQSWSLLLEDEEKKLGSENTILAELEATHKNLDGLQSFSNNPAEALAEAFGDGSDDDGGETHSTIIEASETPSGSPTSMIISNHANGIRNILQSASKPISHLGSRSRKSVVINPEATLIPSKGDQIVTQPHNGHTAAENRRHRLTWNRRSRMYSPSTWTSPDGHEKYNTSYSRVSWMALEYLMNKVQDMTEDYVKENSALTKETIESDKRERKIEEALEAYISRDGYVPRSGHARVSLLRMWRSREENKQKLKKWIEEEIEQ
ncbi:hypothetical protein PTMSG1_10357 [Pyrenophora teres f. maculata]|nr:hypothetical protein PTMSG1_10357 [Pyrenophora teres f. maculata]